MRLEEQFHKIIDNIMWQDYHIKALYDLQPNRIILGKYVYDILATASDAIWHRAEICKVAKNSDIEAYVIGLPVTVDYNNKWIIEVCYGLKHDGKQLLYPDKIDPEENG